MDRKLGMLLAVALLSVSLVPTASAQLVDESVEITIPEPVNQTTKVSIVVGDDGTTTLTVIEEGNVSNETVQSTVPEAALDLVNDVVDLVIYLCDTAVGALPGAAKC